MSVWKRKQEKDCRRRGLSGGDSDQGESIKHGDRHSVHFDFSLAMWNGCFSEELLKFSLQTGSKANYVFRRCRCKYCNRALILTEMLLLTVSGIRYEVMLVSR